MQTTSETSLGTPLVIGKPIFHHQYISECTFLGSFNGHDLYHSILSNGKIMLIDRYNNGTYCFEATESSKYSHNNEITEVILEEAYRRSKLMNLEL